MKKRYLIFGLTALCASFAIAGCASSEFDKGAEYTENYTKRYNAPTTDGVTMDGKLDEAFWADKAYFEQSYLANTNGSEATMKITAVPKETGVYIGSVIYDTNVTKYDDIGSLALSKSTSWEIPFFSVAKGEDPATFTTTEAQHRRHYFYMDPAGNFLLSNPGLYGEGVSYIEGEPNSGNTEYISFEAFIPWETLKIDTTNGAPDYFYLLPTFRSISKGLTDASTMQLQPYPWVYPTACYKFGANGYTQPIPEGSVLGNAKSGYPRTGGWDMSKAAQGEVSMTGNTWQHIFFKDVYETNVVVEADIEIPETTNYPRFYSSRDSRVGFTFYDSFGGPNVKTVVLDGLDYTTRKYSTVKVLLADKGGSGGVSLGGITLPQPSNKVNLKVTKLGGVFTVYVNDVYVATVDAQTLPGNVFPGLFTFNMEAKFTNFSCTTYNPTASGEVTYTQKLYLMKEDLTTYETTPVEVQVYGKANDACNLPQMYFADGQSYELYPEHSGSTTEGTINGNGSTVLTGYYKRVYSFGSEGPQAKYFKTGSTVTLEADAIVGKDGQRFNGFVISQGEDSDWNKKLSFVFTDKGVRFQRKGVWDDGGIRAEAPAIYGDNGSKQTGITWSTGTMVQTPATSANNILKSTESTHIKFELSGGVVTISAGGTVYVKANLANLIQDLGMSSFLNANEDFKVGFYGYDCNTNGQNVTFRNVVVG